LYLIYPQPYGSGLSVNVKRKSRFLIPKLLLPKWAIR
jgi:hypothetical protein